MCKDCKYFINQPTPIKYLLIGIGMCNNEDSDHYKHILSCKHSKCICKGNKNDNRKINKTS